jgi:hypothetical protein
MPNVSQFRRPRISRPEPLFLFDARRPTQGATLQMIEQVITHADECTPLANGRWKLRVSATMVEQLQAQGRLGTDGYRLTDLTVTWDETEGQVVQVRDDARLRDASARWAEWDNLWDEESYRAEDTERHPVAA